MVIAAAGINGVGATAGVDRIGCIAANYGVVTGSSIDNESIVRTGGGDAVVAGAGIDALKIIGNGAPYACCCPVAGTRAVGGSDISGAVAVVEGVIVTAKGDRTGDRTSVVEGYSVILVAKVKVDRTTT